MIAVKRIYEPPSPEDGYRVLVDRLWPRGLAREQACLDEWRRDLAPSDALRRWFGHDPLRWEEFRRRYREELQGAELAPLAAKARQGRLALVYAAADREHNNALVLKEALEELLEG
ncbi:MAG: DUF488 family protein [Chloroflexi bacterium]|nr:DUF488 family protein [Chloroflexota bacterium]